MTLFELAKQYNDTYELKTREDGSNYVVFNHEDRDFFMACHGDSMPDDYIYSFISEALDIICDNECETEDEVQELIYEIEGDCYTSDLTKWLNSSNNRVYYLSEALNEYGFNDGFQALSMAQCLEKREIANNVLRGLVERLEIEEAV